MTNNGPLTGERIPLEDRDPLSDSVHHSGSHITRTRRPRSARKRIAPSFQLPTRAIFIGTTCLIVLTILSICGYKIIASKAVKVEANKASAAIDVQAIETERVSKFVRAFVADMLDFSPTTYRISQVHAMASMSPELLQNYWQETHFPLSLEQLKSSPQNMTLMITKVEQERLDELNRKIDIFAELVGANSKLSTPIHLQLKVMSMPDGQLRVLEQKDLSLKK